MLSSGFTLWEREAARGTPFTKALGIMRWRAHDASPFVLSETIAGYIQLLPAARVVEGPLAGNCDSGREECGLRLWGLRIPLLPPSFHISWDMVRFGFGEGLFALLLWTVTLGEHWLLTSTLLHFPWKYPHIYACVCVFGVCVGTEDGAQRW